MIWLGKAKDPREIKTITGNGLLDQIQMRNALYYQYGDAGTVASALADAFSQAFRYDTTQTYSTAFGTFTFHNDIGNETA